MLKVVPGKIRHYLCKLFLLDPLQVQRFLPFLAVWLLEGRGYRGRGWICCFEEAIRHQYVAYRWR